MAEQNKNRGSRRAKIIMARDNYLRTVDSNGTVTNHGIGSALWFGWVAKRRSGEIVISK
jgi:hypothetical protein